MSQSHAIGIALVVMCLIALFLAYRNKRKRIEYLGAAFIIALVALMTAFGPIFTP